MISFPNSAIVSSKSLSANITLCKKAICARSRSIALRGIFAATSERYLELTATDLETRITTKTRCQTRAGFFAVIDPKDLQSATKSTKGDLQLSLGNQESEVLVNDENDSCQSFQALANWQNYPTSPIAKETPCLRLLVDSPELRAGLQQTIFAIDEESTRYALNGILLEYDAATSRLTLVATDGRRMATFECVAAIESGTDEEWKNSSVIVPAKAVVAMISALAKRDDVVTLSWSKEWISLVCDEVVGRDYIEIQSRAVEGRFPNWRQVVPNWRPTVSFYVDSGLLLSKLESLDVGKNDEKELVRGAEFTILERELKMVATNGAARKVAWCALSSSHFHDATSEELETGVKQDIYLDFRYLAEYCAAIGKDRRVWVSVLDENSPVILTYDQSRADCKSSYLVMPMSKPKPKNANK